jgi:hypothetical protein
MVTLTKDIELSEQDVKDILIKIPTKSLTHELLLRISHIQNDKENEEISNLLDAIIYQISRKGFSTQANIYFLQTLPLSGIMELILKDYKMSYVLKTLSEVFAKQELES